MFALFCTILLYLYSYCLSVDFTYHIKEGNMPISYIGDIAVDTHMIEKIKSEERHLIRFNQLQKDKENVSQLFNISKDGKFYVIQTLDAETLCKYKKMCFRMVDVAMQKREIFVRILEIKVVVEDINDHQPVFPVKQITLEFSEGDKKGTTLSIPNAIDEDISEENSRITYKLLSNNKVPFIMVVSERVDGSYSVGITLETELDREVEDHYSFQVIAKDGGKPSKHGILKVYISVLDINDNLPLFSQDVYNISINCKYQINKPVIDLDAEDLDAGENGKVIYHFSSKTSEMTKLHFQLNEKTGEIFLCENFPFEKRQTYELYVEASDGGNPPLSSMTMILVNVVNQRNNPPVIDMNFVSKSSNNMATILENTKIGSFIAYVKISDTDTGQNGKVTCTLQHDKFQLQNLGEKKYKVVLKSLADKEKESHITFKVICEDNGLPRLRTEREFSVLVIDINDVIPQFNKETYKFLIYENEESNFPVGFVNATDPDMGLGGQLTFSLFSKNNLALPFQITNYGFISTTESLDREQKDIYIFQVLVKDSGTPRLNNTVDVIVEVMDKNDNAPYFTFPSVNPFSLDIYFQSHNNNDITKLKAYDKDSKENAFLKYEILEGNEKELFTMNCYTGILSFSRNVYRNEAGVYNLLFVVKDNGIPILSTTTSLSLTLVASNNTFPLLAIATNELDFKIQMNLFLMIIAAAVSGSVIMVISITICVVKKSNNIMTSSKQRINPSDKIFSVDRETQNTSEQISYNPPLLREETQQNSLLQLQEEKEQYLSNYKVTLNGKNLNSRIPYQATSKEIHQIYVQNAHRPASHRKDEEDFRCSFYNYRQMTAKSQNDCEFTEKMGSHYEELSGLHPHQNDFQEASTSQFQVCASSGTNSSYQTGNFNTTGRTNVTSLHAQSLIRTNNLSTTILTQTLPTKCGFSSFSKPLPALPKTASDI
ncbi:protocadherin beta-15-like isoform X1 [Octopus sinensis]|uniref:Protocadherin beta-15-like isoform X1 n=1 Tax=Octopus sinensis TaxID=2607531 RepID=A0A6P7T3E4_9MOLL|nr:protocadherin beta-15-like isoform X1 [Octopus sinensis]